MAPGGAPLFASRVSDQPCELIAGTDKAAPGIVGTVRRRFEQTHTLTVLVVCDLRPTCGGLDRTDDVLARITDVFDGYDMAPVCWSCQAWLPDATIFALEWDKKCPTLHFPLIGSESGKDRIGAEPTVTMRNHGRDGTSVASGET